MRKINGIAAADWTSARELLYMGLHPQKVYDILGIDQATWIETDRLWNDESVVLFADEEFKAAYRAAQENPMSGRFAHITQEEVDRDVQENGGPLYLQYSDDLSEWEQDAPIELPDGGLTLAFLKEHEEYEWLDLIEANIQRKLGEPEDAEELKRTLSAPEYLFRCVYALADGLNWGMADFYELHDDLANDLEKHLATIGAKRHLSLIRRANALYRQIQEAEEGLDTEVEELPPALQALYEQLEELDDKLYNLELEKPLDDILLAYVKKHRRDFVEG